MKSTLSYKAYKNSPYRSVKHTTYFNVYDELFSSYRGKEITFVEIGVLGGGSLFMWREFFGPKARIIGVDFNPNAKKWEDNGFEIYIGNQTDEKFWAEFKEKVGLIDVVLDDGGHSYDQQIITTEMLIGNINDGGMLVVEDTHTSYMTGYGPRKFSFIEYTKVMIDKINLRFGAFGKTKSEKRVWSIRIYESFVAFVVNSPCSELKSEPTDNGGRNDLAADFRFHDNRMVYIFHKIEIKFNIIASVPVVRWFGKKLVALYSENKKFRARGYFR